MKAFNQNNILKNFFDQFLNTQSMILKLKEQTEYKIKEQNISEISALKIVWNNCWNQLQILKNERKKLE